MNNESRDRLFREACHDAGIDRHSESPTEQEIFSVVKAWASEKLPREYDPLGFALADLVARLIKVRR